MMTGWTDKPNLLTVLPRQVHGYSVQQLSVSFGFLHQGNLRVGPRKVLHLLCQRRPGTIQLGSKLLVLLRATLKDVWFVSTYVICLYHYRHHHWRQKAFIWFTKADANCSHLNCIISYDITEFALTSLESCSMFAIWLTWATSFSAIFSWSFTSFCLDNKSSFLLWERECRYNIRQHFCQTISSCWRPAHLVVLQGFLIDNINLCSSGRVVHSFIEGISQLHHFGVETSQTISDGFGQVTVFSLTTCQLGVNTIQHCQRMKVDREEGRLTLRMRCDECILRHYFSKLQRVKKLHAHMYHICLTSTGSLFPTCSWTVSALGC